MLAAVAKRAKLTFFDDPYRSLASNSNKSKKKNIKKPTVSASVHSKLWMTMSWNARPLGERDTMFFLQFFKFFLSPLSRLKGQMIGPRPWGSGKWAIPQPWDFEPLEMVVDSIFLFFFELPQGFCWSFSMDSSQSWELRRSKCWRWVFLGVIFGEKHRNHKFAFKLMSIRFVSFWKKVPFTIFVPCFYIVDSKLISLVRQGNWTIHNWDWDDNR